MNFKLKKKLINKQLIVWHFLKMVKDLLHVRKLSPFFFDYFYKNIILMIKVMINLWLFL